MAATSPSAPAEATAEGRRPRATFACPRPGCRATVVPDDVAGAPSLRCPACSAVYPILPGELPILVPYPGRHLAIEAIRLRRDLAWFQQQRGLLASGERRFPRRAASQRRIRTALDRTSDFFSDILATLVARLDPGAVVDVAAQPPPDSGAYGARRICSHLRRDFGGQADGESEIAHLVGAVMEELMPDQPRLRGGRPARSMTASPSTAPLHRRVGRGSARVLVLGCGAGRLAEDLAGAGWAVTAIDLSVVLLSAAFALREGPVELYDVQTRNARQAVSQAEAIVTSRRPADATARKARYVVADAAAMPFPAKAWPVIVSVYFTDVVPLSRLLPEIWRVLAPRGRFIHVGPLGYHFDEPAEHLAADELIDAFRFAGFTVGPPRWVPGTYHKTSGSLCARSFDNLVFTARKARRQLGVDTPLLPFRAA